MATIKNKDIVGIIDKISLYRHIVSIIREYYRTILTHGNSNDNFHIGFKSKYNLNCIIFLSGANFR